VISEPRAGADAPALFVPPFATPELARRLDEMREDVRVETIVKLGKRQLAPLFEAAAANEPLRLTDLVPADAPPLAEVIHEGKNSLPLFTRFQKRFCRPPAGQSDDSELWGYNEQPFRTATGPGYFVVHRTNDGELVVDYTRLPPGKPPAWPRIIPNSARLSRFIYYQTTDVLRRVSRHVVIGRAYRKGRPFDAWFALVRRDR
jgi:hypothetical protein